MRLVYSFTSATIGLLLLWIAIFGRPDVYLSRAMNGLTALTGISAWAAFGPVRDWLDGVDTVAVAAPAPRGQADVSAVDVLASPKLDTRSVDTVAIPGRTIGTSSCSSDAGSNFGDAALPASPAPGHDPAATGVSATPAASSLEHHTYRTASRTTRHRHVAKRSRDGPLPIPVRHRRSLDRAPGNGELRGHEEALRSGTNLVSNASTGVVGFEDGADGVPGHGGKQ